MNVVITFNSAEFSGGSLPLGRTSLRPTLSPKGQSPLKTPCINFSFYADTGFFSTEYIPSNKLGTYKSSSRLSQ